MGDSDSLMSSTDVWKRERKGADRPRHKPQGRREGNLETVPAAAGEQPASRSRAGSVAPEPRSSNSSAHIMFCVREPLPNNNPAPSFRRSPRTSACSPVRDKNVHDNASRARTRERTSTGSAIEANPVCPRPRSATFMTHIRIGLHYAATFARM